MKHKSTWLCLLVFPLLFISAGGSSNRSCYALTVYHFDTKAQEQVIDNYLRDALLPALHRLKVSNIGVFKAISNDTTSDKQLYVIMSLPSVEAVTTLQGKLADDKTFPAAGEAYINAPYNAPAFKRKETILLQAFPLAPQMELPRLNGDRSNRIYELRSYESASEMIFRNKVKMFNEGGEIALFKRLNFNAIFYSEVIAGDKMPNLMYMTSFENMADRDAHWKAFVEDPEWKKLSSMPEYQNNVSKIDITFLRPTAYSDF